jgi:hypothetical protein
MNMISAQFVNANAGNAIAANTGSISFTSN